MLMIITIRTCMLNLLWQRHDNRVQWVTSCACYLVWLNATEETQQTFLCVVLHFPCDYICALV